MGRLLAPLTLLAGLCGGGVSAGKPADTLKVERVVLLMRHGLRPPTKNPPMAAGIATDAWPSWPVNPGWLTPHGAAAVRILGQHDRQTLAARGLFAAKGCPASGSVLIVSDSDQRTIATGNAYIEGLAPGCQIAHRHKPQDEPDGLFGGIEAEPAAFDAEKARAAILTSLGAGGVAGAEAEQAGALARIDHIYCGSALTACGVTARPSALGEAQPGKRPKLTGALDLGSTAAQILLLEYADGKPMAEVGWGRATPADITAVSALHAAEFRILARPSYIAARNVAPIARMMIDALRAQGSAKLTVLVGHDTNVANLGGLLDLHWQATGFAADDPSPGGALGFEVLRDAEGRRFVRAIYRSQTLDQLRELSPSATLSPASVLPLKECAALCPIADFEALVAKKLAEGRN